MMNPSLATSFLLLSLSSAVLAADIFDAPGPGYRNQVESIRASPDPARLQLLRDHPTYLSDPVERAWRVEQMRFRAGIRSSTNPLSLSMEIKKLSPTLLVLPTANPFERPIRLFEVK